MERIFPACGDPSALAAVAIAAAEVSGAADGPTEMTRVPATPPTTVSAATSAPVIVAARRLIISSSPPSNPWGDPMTPA